MVVPNEDCLKYRPQSPVRGPRRARHVLGHSITQPSDTPARSGRPSQLRSRRHRWQPSELQGAAATNEGVLTSLRGLDQQVTNPPDGVYFCGSFRFLQFPPQVMHVNRNSIRLKLVVDAVKLFLKDGLRHDAALSPQHVLQDRAFPTRQI